MPDPFCWLTQRRNQRNLRGKVSPFGSHGSSALCGDLQEESGFTFREGHILWHAQGQGRRHKWPATTAITRQSHFWTSQLYGLQPWRRTDLPQTPPSRFGGRLTYAPLRACGRCPCSALTRFEAKSGAAGAVTWPEIGPDVLYIYICIYN